MGYDGREYVHQAEDLCTTVDEKIAGMPQDAYLIPIVTVVINFSDRKWNQPRSIHELIYPKYKGNELMRFVPDYFINVLDPYDMDDEEIDRMESNLREVMYTVKYSSDRKKLAEIVMASSRFSSLDPETANFIEHYGNIKLNRNAKGGYDMCRAIQEMKDERDRAVGERDKAVGERDKAVVERDKAVEEASKVVEKVKAEADKEKKQLEAKLAKYQELYGELD